MSAQAKPAAKIVAIYCRKSTEEGLDREFNTLDAQRQSCELFAASQQHEGWTISDDRYDDGGFSGGNTDRPALKRLLADIDAGKVHVVAVYKLDRMSRSLTDFVGLLQRLDAKQVAFVSVTQHFNTATPMGRLMLNVLICFAQFERENTIERIRDKVAATKRMGRWCGGTPTLGYEVAPGGRKLVVVEEEAEQVRQIFALYLEHRSLTALLREITRRGWVGKQRTTRAGNQKGGKPYHKSNLGRLLGNILYTGRLSYKGEIIPAEHPPIVDLNAFEEVQLLMASQSRSGGSETKMKHHPLLRNLLRCGPCGCGMTYSWSKHGPRFYAYYVCARSRDQGAETCPMPSIPAPELERLVIDEIAAICRDPELMDRVVTEASAQHRAVLDACRSRLRDAEGFAAAAASAAERAGIQALRERDAVGQARAQVVRHSAALADAESATLAHEPAREVLRQFEPVWSALSPSERRKLLVSLIEVITVDGRAGKVSFVFRSQGIAVLAKRVAAA